MRTLIAILLAATLLWAVNSYATCPYESRRISRACGVGMDCEYRHMHADPANGRFVDHRFWGKCGN